MINTLFVEQISRQINFFAENIMKRSAARQRKRFSSTDMQIWDKPGRLERSSDTAVRWYSRYNGHWKRAKTTKKELKNVWMNFSPTCRQKPQRQCSTTIYCQRNSIFHRPKKNYSLHYLTVHRLETNGNFTMSRAFFKIKMRRLSLYLPEGLFWRRQGCCLRKFSGSPLGS